MPKTWNSDSNLVHAVAENLFQALPMFPKRLVRVDELVREHGMPFSHILILIMLDEESISIGQISDRLGIAKPNITPLIDSMKEQGLVERVRSAEDRRIVNVCLQPGGKAKLDAIRGDIAAQVAGWKGNLSRSEVKELSNAFASIVRIAGSIGE